MLQEVVANACCTSEALAALGLQNVGSNGTTFNRWIKIHNISTEHFEKNYARLNRRAAAGRKHSSEVCVENSTASQSNLKAVVRRENLLEYKCVECSNTGEWMSKSITLQLDHINGNNKDNRITNLRFLCPNCHSQTETWCSKTR